MGLSVVVLLAGLWALILLPGVVRTRREITGINSIHAFERSMSTLARHCGSGACQPEPWPPQRQVLVPSDPARPAGAKSRARMRQRQRAALAQLGSAVCVAGGLALLVGGPLWVVFGVSAAALVGYAALLVQVRARDVPVRARMLAPASPLPPRRDPASAHVRIRRWD